MNRPAAHDSRSASQFILLMGVVAMFGDMTYEGARGLSGPFLGWLGASAAAIGFVAGLGEFLGYGLRIVSGWFADRTRAHWPIVITGYALNLLAVPGLAWVETWQAAAVLMVLERVGKALRSPARSALVSHAAQQIGAGKGFGIDEALDQIGAVSGPLITALVIWVLRDEPVDQRYRAAFLVLLVPVLFNLATVLLARRRFPHPEQFEPPSASEAPPLGRSFYAYLAAVALLALGGADWALVAFHGTRTGQIELGVLPVLYAGAMAADAISALAFGYWFDRVGVTALAVSSLLSAAFLPAIFLAPAPIWFCIGALGWAIGVGAQESIFKAAIAVLVPKAQRARAYGAFFGCFGLAWWLGSTAMGYLYDRSLLVLVTSACVLQLCSVPIFVVIGRRWAR